MKPVFRWIAALLIFWALSEVFYLASGFLAASAAKWLAVLLHVVFGAVAGVSTLWAILIAPNRKVAAVLILALLLIGELTVFTSGQTANWPSKMKFCRLILDAFMLMGIIQSFAIVDVSESEG
jgi:hypothetical protein